jgi:hypothetical protein
MFAKHLSKLVELASGSLIPAVVQFEPFCGRFGNGELEMELYGLLRQRNGFFAYHKGLHVFPFGKTLLGYDLLQWNSDELWRQEYGSIPANVVFFAQDAFGEQFTIVENTVCRFQSETGELAFMTNSLEEWAEKILDDPTYETGYPVLRDWESSNRPILVKERLSSVQPFVMGGEYAVSNLFALDAVELLKYRVLIARSIKDIPDGQTIIFEAAD